LRILRAAGAIWILLVLTLCPQWAKAQTSPEKATETTLEPAPSKFRSADDGWLDVSGFLDEKYGFLPIAIPITEPAVGYGAAVGLAFISSPLGEAREGFGRPDISLAGGLGTDNGSWGLMLGDVRHWFDDRLETQAGIMHLSANLDFNGIGKDAFLERHPIQYNLEPTGGVVRAKYRLGDSTFWLGLGYAFAVTRVTFKAAEGTPGLPDIKRDTRVGGLTPSFTYDTRDNLFTPLRGTFVEALLGIFSPALGADDDFQRLQVTAIHYIPLPSSLYLGLRGDGAATFGDTPFYLKPFISLRGAPIMRYQGDEVASIEAELRWQFWGRFSVLGFVGAGAAWNDAERVNNAQKIVTGGFGFRYEIARKYGIHMGLDLAFAPDNAAVYVQVGSAWSRP
jgi:outer membrane protein assembly factor BamA